MPSKHHLQSGLKTHHIKVLDITPHTLNDFSFQYFNNNPIFSLLLYNLNSFNRHYSFKCYRVMATGLATYLLLYFSNKGITLRMTGMLPETR